MSRFNLDDYEPVEDRLQRFWTDHPDGRMLTELVRAEGDLVIFRAEAYRATDDELPASTGHAHEVTGSSPVNKTSALENCETSAIGRALANLGYAAKGQRPSREEMVKANTPAPTKAPEGDLPGKDGSLPDAFVPPDTSQLRKDWYAAGKEDLAGKEKFSDKELLAYVEKTYGKGKGTKDLSADALKADIEKFRGLKGAALAKLKLELGAVEEKASA